MAVHGSSGINFASFMPGNASVASRQHGDEGCCAAGGDSFSSVLVRVAEFRSQTLSVLTGAMDADESSGAQGLGGLLASLHSPWKSSEAGDTADALGGLSPTGRNMALFDPEAAFRMMTGINKHEVTFKAQFAELSEMKSALVEIREDVQVLGQIDVAAGADAIKAALTTFAGQYNDWVERFDADLASGGLLAGTQAASISRYELEQSVGNIFNGAKEGLHGLRDLGFTIDPVTRRAVIDTAELDAVLLHNPEGAVATLHEFAANFAKSAELLNSAGNFIPNRLGNLERVIDYIGDNKTSLQAEFGLGEAAKPTQAVAQALARYQQTQSL